MGLLLLENGNLLLQEDGLGGILLEGAASVGAEFKIINNLIVDSNRVTYITPIFNVLKGLQYHPLTAETIGLGFYQVGDRIVMQDQNGNAYETVITSIDLNLVGGLLETIKSDVPPQTTTNYDFAGVVGGVIKNTQIIVNKQQGEIDLINTSLTTNYYTQDQTTTQIQLTAAAINSSVATITSAVNTALSNGQTNANAITAINTSLTSLNQTASNLTLLVNSSGGSNLLKNSVGLKGDIQTWQILNPDGSLADSRNSGTIDQSNDTAANSESGSAIIIANQYITQTFSTISGQTYTAYFRYKNTLACTVTITGVSSTISIPISASWTVFKYQFIATGSSTTFRIENGSGASCSLSDLVIKLGNVTGWVQAPNEVYGKNFTFDKNGFSITSLTNPFKAVLDNQKLTIYDTSGGGSKVLMQIAIGQALLTDAVIQDQLIIQRYGNPAASTRIIPTATGSMIVVND